MAYRNDPDLRFLEDLSNMALEPLFEVLTKDKDGEVRLTEELTNHDRVVASHPDHHQYWDLIAAEIQCFGANTFATVLRGGEGVLYREVLTDVCDKMKVNYSRGNDDGGGGGGGAGSRSTPVDRLEMYLLMKVLEDATAKMSVEELKEICGELGISPKSYTRAAVILLIWEIILKDPRIYYKIAVIVANAVAKAMIGRGLGLAATATLSRSLAIVAGPVAWVLLTLWTLLDIAGPAYRVTIPAVIVVAYLRQEAMQSESPAGPDKAQMQQDIAERDETIRRQQAEIDALRRRLEGPDVD